MRVLRVSLLLAILTVIALGRVAATWDVFSPTFDEPAHLAAGMEWLDRGVYRYEEMHGPLARIAVALGPYADGLRSDGKPGMWMEGNAILNQRGRPERALALARAGILPFFLATILVVFFWTRDLAGDSAALLAVLALTCVPPVLAHSGLATTDAAAMAMLAATVFAMVRWLERPGLANTCWLGFAAGLALLSKMSALVFLPAAGAAVLLTFASGRRALLPYVGTAAAAGLVMGLTLWAGYRFSFGSIRHGPVMTQTTETQGLKRRLAPVLRLPIFPAPEYPRGILQLIGENRNGRRNYLLGERIESGRWYFFPVALGVKTPVAFLVLAGVGGATLIGMARRRRSAAVPVVAAAAILGTAMAANINIGVRHILPVYPLLAIAAGLGISRLWHWRRWRYAGPAMAMVLTGWLLAESARTHPDYLPYFNQLAGDQPERVLLDSDLDWGQDLRRLADTLRARRVPHVSIAYHGKVDMSKQGLPPFTELQAHTPVTGWVAASEYRLQLGYMSGSYDPFAWLLSHTPVARVGHSIRLYYIDPASPPAR